MGPISDKLWLRANYQLLPAGADSPQLASLDSLWVHNGMRACLHANNNTVRETLRR